VGLIQSFQSRYFRKSRYKKRRGLVLPKYNRTGWGAGRDHRGDKPLSSASRRKCITRGGGTKSIGTKEKKLVKAELTRVCMAPPSEAKTKQGRVKRGKGKAREGGSGGEKQRRPNQKTENSNVDQGGGEGSAFRSPQNTRGGPVVIWI